jgi:hypothetical protein
MPPLRGGGGDEVACRRSARIGLPHLSVCGHDAVQEDV